MPKKGKKKPKAAAASAASAVAATAGAGGNKNKRRKWIAVDISGEDAAASASSSSNHGASASVSSSASSALPGTNPGASGSQAASSSNQNAGVGGQFAPNNSSGYHHQQPMGHGPPQQQHYQQQQGYGMPPGGPGFGQGPMGPMNPHGPMQHPFPPPGSMSGPPPGPGRPMNPMFGAPRGGRGRGRGHFGGGPPGGNAWNAGGHQGPTGPPPRFPSPPLQQQRQQHPQQQYQQQHYQQPPHHQPPHHQPPPQHHQPPHQQHHHGPPRGGGHHGSNRDAMLEKINTVAAQLVQKLNRAQETWITAELLQNLIHKHFQKEEPNVDSRGLNYQMRNAPVVKKVLTRNREIHTFITAHCAARVITTLYDLQCEICAEMKVEKNKFSEIGLGNLLYHPQVIQYFKPAASLRNVPQITAIDLANHLHNYRRPAARRGKTDVKELLDYIVEREGVENAYELCVQIKGIGLLISMSGKAFRNFKSMREEIDAELARGAETQLMEAKSQSMVQLGARALAMGQNFDNFVHFWRARSSDMPLQKLVTRMLATVARQKRGGIIMGNLKGRKDELRVLCQIAAIFIRDVVPVNSAVALAAIRRGDSAANAITIEDGEKKRELIEIDSSPNIPSHHHAAFSQSSAPSSAFCASSSSASRVSDFEVESAFVALLGKLDAAAFSVGDFSSLAKLEGQVCEQFGVGKFADLGHGPFLQFVASRDKISARLSSGASSSKSPARSVPFQELLGFISQCLDACDGAVGAETLETFLDHLACSQFELSDSADGGGGIASLGFGTAADLVAEAKQSRGGMADAGGGMVDAGGGGDGDGMLQWLRPVIAGFDDASQDDDLGIGALGKSLTEDEIFAMLQNAPYLCDLRKWTQWEHVAASDHGELGWFLRQHRDALPIHVVEISRSRFFRIDPDFTANDLLARASCADANGTAVGLASIACAHKSLVLAPRSLMRNHLQTAFASIHAEEAEANVSLADFVLDVLRSLDVLDSALSARMFDVLVSPSLADVLEKPFEALLDAAQSSRSDLTMLHGIGLRLGVTEWVDSYKAAAAKPLEVVRFNDLERPASDKANEGADASPSPGKSEVLEDDSASPMDLVTSPPLSSAPAPTQKGGEAEAKTQDGSASELNNPEELDGGSSSALVAAEEGGISPLTLPAKFAEKETAEARDAVRSILLRQFGEGLELKPDAREVFELQNARIGRALEGLSKELYADEAHFVLELVQNADDNSYADGVCPTLKFLITSEVISLENNEVGFKEKNIRALCDVGKSTKKATESRYIGQKGIGFKSVFRITSCPEIHSGGFRIRFDASGDKIGYIKPIWIEEPTQALAPGWNTKIVLPLDPTESASTIRNLIRKFDDVDPNILLFLHRLQKIVIHDQVSNVTKSMRCITSPSSSIVTIRHSRHASGRTSHKDEDAENVERDDLWLLVKKVYEPKVRRDGVGATEISIAFPFVGAQRSGSKGGGSEGSNGGRMSDEDMDLALSPVDDLLSAPLPQQRVFAFLPLRSYGFRFVINADWIVPSSREQVDASSPWNEWLRSEVPQLFVRAFESFKEEHLRHVSQAKPNSKLSEAKEANTEASSSSKMSNDDDDVEITGERVSPNKKRKRNKGKKRSAREHADAVVLEDDAPSAAAEVVEDPRVAEMYRAVSEYLRFVPLSGEIASFFRPVAGEIVKLLRKTKFLPTQTGEWVMPHSLLLPPSSEIISSLIDSPLLVAATGKDFLHRSVSMSESVRRSLHIRSFGVEHLMSVLEHVCRSPDEMKRLPLDWVPRALYALFQLLQSEQDQRRAANRMRGGRHGFRGGAAALSLDPEVTKKLKSLRLVRLEANDKVVAMNEGLPVFFPVNEFAGASQGLKAAFDAFAGELCVLSPRMLLLGDRGSSSNNGGGGGEIVQTSLRFIYEQLGVRTLSPHDLVHLHILPRLREAKPRSTPPPKADAYTVFLKLFVEQMPKSPSQKKLLDELREVLVVRTNHGSQLIGKGFHFSRELGNTTPKELLDCIADKWTFVQDVYTKWPRSGDVESWRRFFGHFGVCDFVVVLERKVDIDDLSESKQWRAESFAPDLRGEPVTVADYHSPELEALLEIGGAEEKRHIVETLDKHWATHYNHAARAQVSLRNGSRAPSLVVSSFVLTMRRAKWLPVVDALGCEVPSRVFQRSTEVFNLFGSSVRYLMGKIRNPQFVNALGILTAASISPRLVLDRLEEWSSEESFAPNPDQYMKIYRYLARYIDDPAVCAATRECAASHNIIFLPSASEENPDEEGTVFTLKDLYPINRVVFEDPTEVVDAIGSIRALTSWQRYRKDAIIREFFEKVGVHVQPSVQQYSATLVQMTSGKRVRDVKPEVLRILSHLGALYTQGTISGAELGLQMRASLVFPTTENEWTAPRKGLYLADDVNLLKLFEGKSTLKFMALPKMSSQAGNIEKLLTEVLLVPRLSMEVKRSTLTEHLQMNTVLSAFLQYNAGFIQRYIYWKHSNIYHNMVSSGIPDRLRSLTFSVAENVHVTYTLEDVTTEAVPCSCVLEQSGVVISLTVKEADITNYAEIYGELSRLFFGKRNQDMANFLHLLTGEQRAHANDDKLDARLEKTCVDNKVFELPDNEQRWIIAERAHLGDASRADMFSHHERIADHAMEAVTDSLKIFEDLPERQRPSADEGSVPPVHASWPPRDPNAVEHKANTPMLPSQSAPSRPRATEVDFGDAPELIKVNTDHESSREVVGMDLTEDGDGSGGGGHGGGHGSSSSSSHQKSSSSASGSTRAPGSALDPPGDGSESSSQQAAEKSGGSEAKASANSTDANAQSSSDNGGFARPQGPPSGRLAADKGGTSAATGDAKEGGGPPAARETVSLADAAGVSALSALSLSPSSSSQQARRRNSSASSVGSRISFFAPRMSPSQVLEQASISLDLPSGVVREVQRTIPNSEKSEKSDEAALAVGRWGEELVYRLVKHRFPKCTIVWKNESEESGEHFDIEIIQENNTRIFIEVKSSKSTDKSLFELSLREIEFATEKGASYHIYRVRSAGTANPAVTCYPNVVDLWRKNAIVLYCGV